MSSDERNRPAAPRFAHAGIGMVTGFICPVCGIKRGMLGRRLRKHAGLRQWVCVHCAGAKR